MSLGLRKSQEQWQEHHLLQSASWGAGPYWFNWSTCSLNQKVLVSLGCSGLLSTFISNISHLSAGDVTSQLKSYTTQTAILTNETDFSSQTLCSTLQWTAPMTVGRASLAAGAPSHVQPYCTTSCPTPGLKPQNFPPCKERRNSDGRTSPAGFLPMQCMWGMEGGRGREGGRCESTDGALSQREKSCRVLRETISDANNILRLWRRRSQGRHGFMSWMTIVIIII